MAAIAARDDDDGLLAIAEDLDPLALAAVPNKTTGEENTPVVVAAARRRRGFERRAIQALTESLKSHQRMVTAERSLLTLAASYADVVFAVDSLLGDGIYSGNAAPFRHATRATASLDEHVSRFAAVVHSGKAGKLVTKDEAVGEAVSAAWALERPNILANDVLPCALAVACRADARGDKQGRKQNIKQDFNVLVIEHLRHDRFTQRKELDERKRLVQKKPNRLRFD